ncbi:MAG TPA: hypothetical protein VG937_24030 [Polyangiaceae bacterium]|nr:hypothetical protein [Polyangiaceae bacterium]
MRSRSGIRGLLLLDVYDGDALVSCGGVGTGQGQTADVLTEMRRGFATLSSQAAIRQAPASGIRSTRASRYGSPEPVAVVSAGAYATNAMRRMR